METYIVKSEVDKEDVLFENPCTCIVSLPHIDIFPTQIRTFLHKGFRRWLFYADFFRHRPFSEKKILYTDFFTYNYFFYTDTFTHKLF